MNPTTLSKSDINKAKFRKLALAIITLADISWPEYKAELRTEYESISFKKKDDTRIGFSIRADVWNGKLEVSASFYKDNKYKGETELWINNQRALSSDCGFGIDRDASAIISGIEKRFFPNFNINATHMIARFETEDKYITEKNNTNEEICNILGVKPELSSISKEFRETIYVREESMNGYFSSIRVNSADSITIEMRGITKEQAIKFIEFAKKN